MVTGVDRREDSVDPTPVLWSLAHNRQVRVEVGQPARWQRRAARCKVEKRFSFFCVEFVEDFEEPDVPVERGESIERWVLARVLSDACWHEC